jgi:hypothetical protein
MVHYKRVRCQQQSLDGSGAGGFASMMGDAASLQSSGNKRGNNNGWFEAFARAWGQAMDKQASVIENLSDQVANGGQDQPSQMILLSAEAQRMGFMATNASTSTNSIGEALETLGKKSS